MTFQKDRTNEICNEISDRMIKEIEGNILFSDALNTFYLRLYGVRHMVKNHSDMREKTCFSHLGYSFRLATRVLLYVSSNRQDNTYNGLCYTCRGALAGTRNRLQLPEPVVLKWCKHTFYVQAARDRFPTVNQ